MVKAILLDRDGVLNEEIQGQYVNSPDDLRVFPFAGHAVSIFNSLGYKCYLITNQSGIALGHLTYSTLVEIHNKLFSIIRECGGKIERVYTCPHLDGDYMCKCRKPKPGLILQAADDKDIDLTKSWFIGDRPSDIGAAHNAGCPVIAVLSGFLDHEKIDELDHGPDAVFQNVLDFAEWLQKESSSKKSEKV